MTEPTAGGPNSQQQNVVISIIAYTKMVLHAIRNPTSQVHGILVGVFREGPTLTITDVVPLFHSAPTKPILDIALRLAETSINVSKSSLSGVSRVVGLYTANERLGDDEQPGQASLRIMGNISKRFGASPETTLPVHAEPIIILIQNMGLASMIGEGESSQNVIKMFGRDNCKHWIRSIKEEYFTVSNEEGNNIDLLKCIEIVRAACAQDEAKLPMFDFENHMDYGADSVRKTDWLNNAAVVEFIRRHD